MLKRYKALQNYTVYGKDGDVGKVTDVYFDSCTWDVRYLIIDTGPWLFGRKVLISVYAVTDIPVQKEKIIRTNLTQEQIKNSPEVDVVKPVSKQQLEALHKHYDWLWIPERYPSNLAYSPPGVETLGTSAPSDNPPVNAGTPETIKEELKETLHNDGLEDPCLRSCHELDGYSIQATDGELGHADDFFIEEETWKVRYLLVKTGPWLLGKSVPVSTEWITRIVWSDKDIYVDLTREALNNIPEYDDSRALERDYEIVLHQHLSRKAYWNTEEKK